MLIYTIMERIILILTRGLRLKCPECGYGALYNATFKMKKSCSHCGLVFEREQGYFVGAIYLNVLATEGLVLGAYIVFSLLQAYFGFSVSETEISYLLYGLCIVLPFLFFPHSRSLWLSVDHIIDPPASSPLQREK
jgi:hypothetical protein